MDDDSTARRSIDIEVIYLSKPGGAINSFHPSGYHGQPLNAFLATLRPVHQWLGARVRGRVVWINPDAHSDAVAEIMTYDQDA